MASIATSSQSNRESLGCTGMGDWLHGCAAKILQQLHNTIMSIWTTMVIKAQIGVSDANKNCTFTNIVHRAWILTWHIITFCDLDWSVLTDWWTFFARGRHTAIRECSSDLCKQSELFLLFSDFPLFSYSSPSDWIGLLNLPYLSSLKLSCSSVIIFKVVSSCFFFGKLFLLIFHYYDKQGIHNTLATQKQQYDQRHLLAT